MTILDLNPNADASIANVNITEGPNNTAILEGSTDRMALMTAVMTAISNGHATTVQRHRHQRNPSQNRLTTATLATTNPP